MLYTKKGFTLLEVLIVISIIAILTTVSLKLNRGQIKDMEAMTDKEQRLSRHKKYNMIITNTNFINNQKISSITRTYSGGSNIVNISSSGNGLIEQYVFNNHKISGDIQIIKQPLQLSCSTVNGKNRLELIGKNKTSCFKLNTNLCTRTSCE